jgi:hypothetical protein
VRNISDWEPNPLKPWQVLFANTGETRLWHYKQHGFWNKLWYCKQHRILKPDCVIASNTGFELLPVKTSRLDKVHDHTWLTYPCGSVCGLDLTPLWRYWHMKPTDQSSKRHLRVRNRMSTWDLPVRLSVSCEIEDQMRCVGITMHIVHHDTLTISFWRYYPAVFLALHCAGSNRWTAACSTHTNYSTNVSGVTVL